MPFGTGDGGETAKPCVDPNRVMTVRAGWNCDLSEPAREVCALTLEDGGAAHPRSFDAGARPARHHCVARTVHLANRHALVEGEFGNRTRVRDIELAVREHCGKRWDVEPDCVWPSLLADLQASRVP